jgi:hypothetical protein
VFSLDSSISGGKWTDWHWKAAKHLVRYIRGASDLCLTFDGNGGKRIILADMERQTGHRRRPCPVTRPPSSARGRHYSSAGPLSLDVSFLPQLLSLLSRFNRPINLYHHQYIRRQPPAHGRVQLHAPSSSVPAENYARTVDVASMRVVNSSRADRSVLSAAIPLLLGRGAFACAHTVQKDIAG